MQVNGRSETLYISTVQSIEEQTRSNLALSLEELNVKNGQELSIVDPVTSPNTMMVRIEFKKDISKLPKEILGKILVYLVDKELLAAADVCKSFTFASELAFIEKYQERVYNLNYFNVDFHKKKLTKFGQDVKSVFIGCNKNDELMALIEQNCIKLNAFKAFWPTRLPSLHNLCTVQLDHIRHITVETFHTFIDSNRNMKHLFMSEFDPNVLQALHSLLSLQELSVHSAINDVADVPEKMNLSALDILRINFDSSTNCIRVLRKMKFNPVKTLNVAHHDNSDDQTDVLINEISAFKMLRTVKLHLSQDGAH